MKDAVRPEVVETLLKLGLLVLTASLAIWGGIIRRIARRDSVVPLEPRRPVPWQFVDLVLVFAFDILATGVVVDLDRYLFPGVANPPAGQAQAAGIKPSTEHDVLVLLRKDRSLAAFALCLVAAVVVAPITEEVFFRLLFQGWLEKLENQWQPGIGVSWRAVGGVLPILGSSLAFALPHFRRAAPVPGAEAILHILVCGMLAKVATTVFALVLVRSRVGATAIDLGFRRGELLRDIGLGLGAAVAVVPWLYGLQVFLSALLPQSVAPDPFTLFPFAVVLGLLYYRTHRIVPSIVLHAVLNTLSLVLAWYALA